jgi:hypothetical protein
MQINPGRSVRLPAAQRAAKMPRMSGSRFRSLVAGFAVLALLLCQAAGLVQARAFDWAATQQTGSGCHSVPGEHGEPDKAAHIPCDSAQTVGEVFKLPAVTAVFLTASSSLFLAPANANGTPAVMHLAHAGAPPPLHLLYARLRN